MKPQPLLKAGALLAFSLTIYHTPAQGQVYVNEEWATSTGLPTNVEWSASHLDANGDLIILGNTYTSGQNTNMLLTKYDDEGTMLWQVEYDGSASLDDHGVALTTDVSGNIYVAGATETSGQDNDVAVIKYDGSGSMLWDYTYNGAGSGEDAPTNIGLDGSGDIVVAGSSQGVNSDYDYLTLKLSASGALQWVEDYDHNGFDDVVASMTIDMNTDEITIAGSVGDQANVYDLLTIEYDANGAQNNLYQNNHNVGLDQPNAMATGPSGEIVVGGYYIDGGGAFKISLLSVDQNLSVNWNQTIDISPGEESINDLAISSTGEIYVTGFQENQPGYITAYTAKYDASGANIWEHEFQSPTGEASGTKLILDAQGNVNVAGRISDAGNINFLLLQYDKDGALLFEQEFDEGGAEQASGILSDANGNFYVNGVSSFNGVETYSTVMYSTYERVLNPTTSLGGTDYIANELIIQFDPDEMIMSAVDNTGKTFGELKDFVSQDVINQMNALYEDPGSEIDFGSMTAVKIFRTLTSDQTHSTSRMGEQVPIPAFWSTLAVALPNSLDVATTMANLNTLEPYVDYAEPNLIGELDAAPNDSYYASKQLSLNGNITYDIRAERAWDVYTGSPTVKVGVFDSGLEWSHSDFGNGTYPGSKIAGGWDFINHTHISNHTHDANGHGTKCAGIIGAIRNNNKHVSGIAGGDAAVGNTGCKLYGFKILHDDGGFLGYQPYLSDAAVALFDGALYIPASGGTPQRGYGLHVMSNSWSIKEGVGDPLFTTGNKNLLYRVNRFAFKNQAVMVCSRGNFGNNNHAIPGTAGLDEFAILVGASGTNGGRHTSGWSSNYGKNVDLIAPGASSTIYTTNNSDNSSTSFSGTSAGCPHVSGTAGLMISYAIDEAGLNTLTTEDVEFLLQKYTTFAPGQTGYSQFHGWGRLNAGKVMEHLKYPDYKIYHPANSTTQRTLLQSGVTRVIGGNPEPGSLPGGTYVVDIYEVTMTMSHNIGRRNLVDYWARNSSSNLWANTSPIVQEVHCELTGVTSTQATMKGYTYHVRSKGGTTIDQWWPVDLSSGGNGIARFAYTLHTYDPYVGIEEIELPEIKAEAYPNPASDVQTLVLINPNASSVNIDIVDTYGRTVKNVFNGPSNFEMQIDVSIEELAPAVYFYRVQSANQVRVIKFVKQ